MKVRKVCVLYKSFRQILFCATLKLMKKIFYALLSTSLLFFLFLIVLTPNSLAAPGCFPMNPWTGLCDSGVACPYDSQMWGLCCDTLEECNSAPPPPPNQIVCKWDDVTSSCVVAAHTCDPNTGNPYPDPNFCKQFASAATCQGQLGGCVANPSRGQLIFCEENNKPTDDPRSGKVYTAIGCIPVANTQEFVRFLLPWAMGVAGGIAFVLMIYAGFMIMTSAGDPRRLQAGKELLTAAIMGLLLLVLGAYLLRLIGVNILGIF